ncbi:MAG: lipase [Planctomycetota bacterium]|nr:lipase [Planctomycetota bacterium]
MIRLLLFSSFLLVLGGGVRTVAAQALPDDDEAPAAAAGQGHLNVLTPTLGGKQLWTDELVFRDWRIQRHAYTGHCRLLDNENHRRAWGTFQHCRDALEQFKVKLLLPPLGGKVVIALHGIIRTRASMAGMCEFLERDGGYTALNVSYASTRSDLNSHAAALALVVENLGPGVTEINFVAHSLGNLVIRRYLADCYQQRNGLTVDSRLHRIVMLAPPNSGAHLAEIFKNNVVVDMVWGQSARQLAEGWDQLRNELAVPRCQFGILAGGVGTPGGRNRWLQGDDDLVVSVEETKLPGARDFAVLPVIHGWIMDEPLARKYTLMFLQHGHFVSEAQRHPLGPETSKSP